MMLLARFCQNNTVTEVHFYHWAKIWQNYSRICQILSAAFYRAHYIAHIQSNVSNFTFIHDQSDTNIIFKNLLRFDLELYNNLDRFIW